MADQEGAPTVQNGVVFAMYPDVCLKDGAKIPYDCYALASDDESPSEDVRYGGARALNEGSRLRITYDDAEAQAGVKSGVVGGYCRPVADMSATVRVNGQRGVRGDTEFEMNCAGPEGLANTKGKLMFLGILPNYLRQTGPLLGTEEWEKARQETLERMKEKFDQPDFYEALADYDVLDGDLWNDMVDIQGRFARSEPFYSDVATRVYSESVRQTLHGAVINLFEDPQALMQITGPDGIGLYNWYIRMHGTAFRMNGAWNLDFLDNGLEVLGSIDPEMLRNADLLIHGMQETDPFAECSAERVRAMRARQGLKVSRRPGEPPQQDTVGIRLYDAPSGPVRWE